MALAIRGMGRCWEDAGEQKRGPVSLGINLATGSTNRLSPPISRRHTDTYLYCQVAAVAAAVAAVREKRRDSSKKLRRYWDSSETKCNATEHIKGPGSVSGSDSWEGTEWKTLPEVSCEMFDIFSTYFQPNENKVVFVPSKTQHSSRWRRLKQPIVLWKLNITHFTACCVQSRFFFLPPWPCCLW